MPNESYFIRIRSVWNHYELLPIILSYSKLSKKLFVFSNEEHTNTIIESFQLVIKVFIRMFCLLMCEKLKDWNSWSFIKAKTVRNKNHSILCQALVYLLYYSSKEIFYFVNISIVLWERDHLLIYLCKWIDFQETKKIPLQNNENIWILNWKYFTLPISSYFSNLLCRHSSRPIDPIDWCINNNWTSTT